MRRPFAKQAQLGKSKYLAQSGAEKKLCATFFSRIQIQGLRDLVSAFQLMSLPAYF
jgi:hypothetical protein